MATPTYDELLSGSTRWVHSHKGVKYMLNFHGYRRGDEYELAQPMPGIWCYYLMIPEQMYPHRWPDFACKRDANGFEHHGPAFEHDMFDSEITWASSEPYFCRKSMRIWDASQVGCDYAHLWHRERGYPDTYQSVKRDAIATVEAFLARHPDRNLRSAYSGIWDVPDKFYTAVNGSLVHIDDEIPEHRDGWKPAVA